LVDDFPPLVVQHVIAKRAQVLVSLFLSSLSNNAIGRCCINAFLEVLQTRIVCFRVSLIPEKLEGLAFHIPIPPQLDLPISYNFAPSKTFWRSGVTPRPAKELWTHFDGV